MASESERIEREGEVNRHTESEAEKFKFNVSPEDVKN
jgi:hypothetical protein